MCNIGSRDHSVRFYCCCGGCDMCNIGSRDHSVSFYCVVVGDAICVKYMCSLKELSMYITDFAT